MHHNTKRAWVKALRSGKFKQGQNALAKNENGEIKHCCLGVLCEIRRVPRTMNANGIISFVVDSRYSSGFLPTPVGRELKTGQRPSITLPYRDRIGVTIYQLDSLNDDDFTFDQIADLIEYFGVDELVSYA